MGLIARDDSPSVTDTQQNEMRNMVLAGLDDIRCGRTKDLNEVCDRLEQKYRNAAVQR